MYKCAHACTRVYPHLLLLLPCLHKFLSCLPVHSYPLIHEAASWIHILVWVRFPPLTPPPLASFIRSWRGPKIVIISYSYITPFTSKHFISCVYKRNTSPTGEMQSSLEWKVNQQLLNSRQEAKGFTAALDRAGGGMMSTLRGGGFGWDTGRLCGLGLGQDPPDRSLDPKIRRDLNAYPMNYSLLVYKKALSAAEHILPPCPRQWEKGHMLKHPHYLNFLSTSVPVRPVTHLQRLLTELGAWINSLVIRNLSNNLCQGNKEPFIATNLRLGSDTIGFLSVLMVGVGV